MAKELAGVVTRRTLLRAGLVAGGAAAIPAFANQLMTKPATPTSADAYRVSRPAFALPPEAPLADPLRAPAGMRKPLFDRAKAALEQHTGRVAYRDRIAIVDFSEFSARPRLHIVNLEAGTATSLLVSHGSGSDPGHTGFLQRFSNIRDSNASSEGAFVTSDYYVGQHGRSQRLIGLDPSNCNAYERAIVIHGAWYANDDMLRTHGKIGRSQGCFAVGERELSTLFAKLGQGRMIYAAKV